MRRNKVTKATRWSSRAGCSFQPVSRPKVTFKQNITCKVVVSIRPSQQTFGTTRPPISKVIHWSSRRCSPEGAVPRPKVTCKQNITCKVVVSIRPDKHRTTRPPISKVIRWSSRRRSPAVPRPKDNERQLVTRIALQRDGLNTPRLAQGYSTTEDCW